MSDLAVNGGRPPLPTPAAWFGKLACTGDFVHRRLEPNARDAWDRWLSAGMARAYDEQDWLAHYLKAPVRCFLCTPGVHDMRWWAGVLMPSVDSAGRYFPLMAAVDAQVAPLDAITCGAIQAWWARIRDAALATLSPGATLASFELALERIPHWQLDASKRADGAALAEAVVAMQRPGSLWVRPVLSEPSDPTFDIYEGLPSVDALASMLVGKDLPGGAL